MEERQSVRVAHAIAGHTWSAELAAQLSMYGMMRERIFLCVSGHCIDLADLALNEHLCVDNGDVVEIYFEDADTGTVGELVRLIESPLLVAG